MRIACATAGHISLAICRTHYVQSNAQNVGFSHIAVVCSVVIIIIVYFRRFIVFVVYLRAVYIEVDHTRLSTRLQR